MRLQFRDSGLYIGSNADGDLDIVSDGTAADSINLESAGGITLDAGVAGTGVTYEDDGTAMLSITNSSSDVVFTSKVQDKDIIFKGDDGGSAITALTLDMSAAGAATFNNDIVSDTGSVRNRPNAKPIIINGSMNISQRSTSVSSLTGQDYNTVDRWKTNIYSAGTWTETQESLSTANLNTTGHTKALKMDCTSADGSLGSDDAIHLQTRLEAQNCQLFKYGTASAEKLTLSFWVKATKTGTNIVEAYQFDDDRICCLSYTVSSSDTWEKKILNFPADSTGVIDNNTGPGLSFNFYMAAGTDYTSGTLQTTWAARTDANRAVGQVNNADNTSNNFEITGVQLEVGEYTSSTLPSFQHETYADNLLRCQRYLVRWDADASYSTFAIMAATTTAEAQTGIQLPVQMRSSSPTLTSSGSFELYGENGSPNVTGLTTATAECAQRVFHLKAAATLTQGSAYNLRSDNNTAAYFYIDTEL